MAEAEYIEREKAMELLSQPITMSMCLSVDECHNKRAQQHIDRYLIENIPAADVRPVVHGKWLDRSSGWTFNSECNKCGFIVHEQFIKTYKYCPNCGADMRGEKDV